MIKSLKKYQIQLTPFISTKNWKLNNTDNTDLLLFESTGSDDGLPFALEFIDFSNETINYPIDNNLCDIALEQQPNDLAINTTGLNVDGIFYLENDPVNNDGTFQRSIYHQVKTMFYNKYLNPSKIWGAENIDFQLSKTKRLLSDKFHLIDIPINVYGEKISPNTVIIYDNSLDNNYTITDDGNGNLFAGTNLFSYQQELGEHENIFISNLTSSYCDYYWNGYNHVPLAPENLYITSGSSILNWSNSDSYVIGFNIEKSINGIDYTYDGTTNLTTYIDRNVSASLNGTQYWYRIYSYTNYLTSSYGNVASISFVNGPDWSSIKWGGIYNDYIAPGYVSQSFNGGIWSGSAYGGNGNNVAECISSGSLLYSGNGASASVTFFNQNVTSYQGFVININSRTIVASDTRSGYSATGTYPFYIPSGSNQLIEIKSALTYSTLGTAFLICIGPTINSASFEIKNIPL